MRELGLAVGAGIFVPEAADDLHVLVAAGHHEELFEKLWRLGQSIEAAGDKARGDEEVACAFGCGLGEEGGFDFEEALIGEEVAHDLGDAVARAQGLLHLRAAEVEIAVGEALFLGDVFVLVGGEGGRGGGGEDVKGFDGNLNFAGSHAGVDEAFALGIQAALAHCAGDGDDPFGAELAGFV